MGCLTGHVLFRVVAGSAQSSTATICPSSIAAEAHSHPSALITVLSPGHGTEERELANMWAP